MAVFNPAPGWPPVPPGWVPPAGWQPPPDWPPAPPGWQFWVQPPAPSVLVQRGANLLVEGVSPHLLVHVATLGTLIAFRNHFGGLWVGGTMTVTDTAFHFQANAANRAVQSGQLDLDIALRDVTGVSLQPGMVTKIVQLDVGGVVVKSRCFGAAEVVDVLRSAIARAR